MSARPLFQPEVSSFRVSFLRKVWRLLDHWCQRHRQRIDLSQLDDHLLADIGVRPQEARYESAKPFWR